VRIFGFPRSAGRREAAASCVDETDIEFSFEDTIKMVQNTI
jgi:hypothetical protein